MEFSNGILMDSQTFFQICYFLAEGFNSFQLPYILYVAMLKFTKNLLDSHVSQNILPNISCSKQFPFFQFFGLHHL